MMMADDCFCMRTSRACFESLLNSSITGKFWLHQDVIYDFAGHMQIPGTN